MNKKTLLKDFGKKLFDIRQSLGHKPFEMADRVGAYRTSYYRYEDGVRNPQLTVLYSLGHSFGISLDWLICDKGPMYYQEKEPDQEKEAAAAPEPEPAQPLREDFKELLDHMERFPRLRYEVLAFFHRCKEEHQLDLSNSTQSLELEG